LLRHKKSDATAGIVYKSSMAILETPVEPEVVEKTA